ncbi:chitinase-like protein Idgf2 [Drosophila gunungcola]|uniref:chitinase-like protein Idgf2 n=1 Tax=Drosophila gunungcola TaxID=103775 RepID=UPI0022E44F6A|nr:chitinase-like protein Idgf2 [Drosophila gunungcola]
MKAWIWFTFVACLFAASTEAASNLVCYYDSSSYTREGLGKLLNPDLEIGAQFCTHLIYGYAGLRGENLQAYSLNENLDIYKHQFSEVTSLKVKYPHLKVLLSVGGDRDIDVDHPNKYIDLLEGEKVRQVGFIRSAFDLVKTYNFDGLDLAYQFPRNKPRKVHGELGSAWKSIKKIFTGDFVVDPQSALHKEQFTAFIRDVKDSLRPDGLLLSLTVLPNVNSTWYFDIPALNGLVDFVNLATFDFLTPARNPDEADYSANIYHPEGSKDRLVHLNADFQVDYWVKQGFPSNKLNLGVATYGNAWKMTKDSGLDGVPVVPETNGPAPEGVQSQKPGLLSFAEICGKLSNPQNQFLKGNDSPLRRINDPTKRYGGIAYRPVDGPITEGYWVSYDDPDSASNKAAYARAKNLGGVALFDLSYDDFRGQCNGEKYPILRAIKYRLFQVNAAPNLVCFYDSQGFQRQGLAQFSMTDMELSLQWCTHLIYGYAGVNADNFEMQSINKRLDLEQRHLAQVTSLKDRYPHIKFFLSVGGDADLNDGNQYIKLLESGQQGHKRFIESARDIVRRYNFDGLDLALQLPRNKPRKVHGDVGSAWKSFKKFFTGDFIVDTESETHKGQLTSLIKDLNAALKQNDLLLSLTVLPNVNSSWYYDAPSIAPSLDLINLGTFDFLTPQRNPEEADFSAPLYEAIGQNRLGHYNVNFQLEHWLLQRVPANKLHIGIATYGKSWKMTKDSGDSGMPVVTATQGAAPAGPQSKKEGLLNWAEICQLMPNPSNLNARGPSAPVKRVLDPTKRYGSYAFRAADENGDHGLWISYDDPDSASSKAQYARVRNLGGVALFDLTQDDFRGQCTNDRFPMLRAIKFRLL